MISEPPSLFFDCFQTAIHLVQFPKKWKMGTCFICVVSKRSKRTAAQSHTSVCIPFEIRAFRTLPKHIFRMQIMQNLSSQLHIIATLNNTLMWLKLWFGSFWRFIDEMRNMWMYYILLLLYTMCIVYVMCHAQRAKFTDCNWYVVCWNGPCWIRIECMDAIFAFHIWHL